MLILAKGGREAMNHCLDKIEQTYKPKKLIENRTSFGGNDAEFSVYDTYQEAERIELSASNPLYCGMITGKKIIHLDDAEPFYFLPQESLVVPSEKLIYIDFPEATLERPTKCITIEIARQKVEDVVAKLNEVASRSPDSGDWEYEDTEYFHFENNGGLERLINTLIYLFTEETEYRDFLIDIKVSELLVRMLRTQSRKLLMGLCNQYATSHGLAAAIQYIKQNLHRPISVKELANTAYMSQPTFYRYFRNEFGMTPVQYITQQRIRLACKLLENPNLTVTDVCHRVGFGNLSHFIRTFKQHQKQSPKQYQKTFLKKKSANQAKLVGGEEWRA